MADDFRLKKLKELKEREVEQETAVLSDYQHELAELSQTADDLDSRLDDYRKDLKARSQTGIPVSELQRRIDWLGSMMKAKQELAQRCHTAGDRVEEQRELLLELHRDERMLERLEEKHKKLKRREELRQQEKELDEARLRNYQFAGGGEGDE